VESRAFSQCAPTLPRSRQKNRHPPLGPPEANRKNIRISAGTLRRAEQLKDEREAHGRAWGERTVVRPEIRGTELARGLRIRAFEGGGERELITFLRFKV